MPHPTIVLLTEDAAEVPDRRRTFVRQQYPEGHFVRALGQVESKEAEQESLLLEFEVPYRPFGIAILDCLPPEGEQWVVPPKGDFDLQNIWRDHDGLRDVIVCSVDPSTSPPPITQSRNVHSDSAPESESLQSPSSTPVTSAASVIPTKYPFNLIITTATIPLSCPVPKKLPLLPPRHPRTAYQLLPTSQITSHPMTEP
ncbi:uncharacterized protein C8R40DRAFT_1065026 [Lentinula edodes]|uniref:uncharacterized protein n=1 Tax=Lentinula edodes TaxID=5353 RepID=UPI001E8D18BE|nr:uncharacterized protein C8R40DRAFT_1065026 [Lentinula edodes]KAH7881333.1 hypothetical protein C8R40DRAFT_1065026 [Lentinula edodes]